MTSQQKYYATHKQELAEYQRIRYAANKEKIAGQRRAIRIAQGAAHLVYQAEQRRLTAIKLGKTYRSRQEIKTAFAARLKRLQAEHIERASRPKIPSKCEAWIEKLKREMPHLYEDQTNKRTLLWRARYNLDPEFKAYECARAARRKRDEIVDDGTLTPSVIASMFAATVCPYCNESMYSRDKTLDHILPKKRGGHHSIKNCIVVCRPCNSSKSALRPNHWLALIDPSRALAINSLWLGITGIDYLSI